MPHSHQSECFVTGSLGEVVTPQLIDLLTLSPVSPVSPLCFDLYTRTCTRLIWGFEYAR